MRPRWEYGSPRIENVFRALRQFLVDPDIFLENGGYIQLGLVVIADLDITGCRERSDDLGGDAIDLPGIQSHSPGTPGAERDTCKVRSRLSACFSWSFSSMCTIAILIEVVVGAPLVVAANRDELYARPTREPEADDF